MLHVEDETDPNLGLTYLNLKIEGVRPFIRMPCKMALSITADAGLKKLQTHSMLAKN
jgi:hypothetical protein